MKGSEAVEDLREWIKGWVRSAISLAEARQRMEIAVNARRLTRPAAALETPFGRRMIQMHRALTNLADVDNYLENFSKSAASHGEREGLRIFRESLLERMT